MQFADNFDFFETEIEDEVELIEFDKIKASEYFGCVLADNLEIKRIILYSRYREAESI